MQYSCKICGNYGEGKNYNVKEMQFGLRDEFVYYHCPECECLQIVNPPENLSKYYPAEYFSFQKIAENLFKSKLNIYRDRYCLGMKSLTGRLLNKIYGEPTYLTWLKNFELDFSSRILDIGCGSGKLVFRLGQTGFNQVTGIDAFIEKDIHYNNGVSIYKKSIFEIQGSYDLVMMHHSLEHMENQSAVFKKLSSIVPAGKFLLIRIPVSSSYAWEKYRENWFALEAPRHFYNHSNKSFGLLAEKYGFEILKTGYDSRSIQFWGSEQYKMDIPLNDKRSYFVNPDNSVFTKEQIDHFEKETKKLNDSGRGDQAVFYLRKL